MLSVKETNDYESTFIGVMITASTRYKDDYSFDLRDDMFENPLYKKNSNARMHLLTLILNNEITGTRINRMKEPYFRQLMASIGDLVFNYQFIPQ